VCRQPTNQPVVRDCGQDEKGQLCTVRIRWGPIQSRAVHQIGQLTLTTWCQQTAHAVRDHVDMNEIQYCDMGIQWYFLVDVKVGILFNVILVNSN